MVRHNNETDLIKQIEELEERKKELYTLLYNACYYLETLAPRCGLLIGLCNEQCGTCTTKTHVPLLMEKFKTYGQQ